MSEDHEKIERLIIKSRNKFRALVDGLEDEVMSIDPGFRITSVNRSLAQGFEFHPRDIVGELCHLALYGFDRPCPEMGQPCPAALARESLGMEVVQHELPGGGEVSGTPKFIDIRAMPLTEEGGELKEIILVRRDITVQRQAEIQIREHNERLEQEVRSRTRDLREVNEELTRQRDKLEETNRKLVSLQALKEDLTNMVIHDMKGPLSEIVANIDMMLNQPLSDFLAELLDAAMVGADNLMRMITNLLDISRMEEDRLVLNIAPVDSGRVLEDIRTRFGLLAKLNNVGIGVEVTEDLPPLMADQRLMERVFVNLVSNALDYTPESGRITISAEFADGSFRFKVRDTGPGIAPELHKKIFEKFSQGQQGPARTGSGLGLTFCRMATEAHGGRIWVESEPGRGSSFIFILPHDKSEVRVE